MGRKGILVLDDDAELAHMFQIALEMEGLKVAAFREPIQVLEYLKNNLNNFFLLITDFIMPKINGIELAHRVREIDKDIKIWLITASSSDDIKHNHHFNSVNIEKVIEKPISIHKLIDMVKSEYIH